ncbi:hypothetical protein CORC01_13289 [Colletotrichum orchidophilum]|uniref:Uncharacterized protein n=1 Tax=Colletotrichum orchidophilum TaxID=1209926 RepID=A0A1G4AQH2_9PEZI|nr:uncharacterized protein CORC01_13289 [Colletotrichum orchidophilum]OHE91424.1 hypothetical protein CORC01_13289 [Colletotrichum orchidophilum]
MTFGTLAIAVLPARDNRHKAAFSRKWKNQPKSFPIRRDAFALVIMALGQLSQPTAGVSTFTTEDQTLGDTDASLYMKLALAIMKDYAQANTLEDAQIWVFASLFAFLSGRPHETWQYLASASNRLPPRTPRPCGCEKAGRKPDLASAKATRFAAGAGELRISPILDWATAPSSPRILKRLSHARAAVGCAPRPVGHGCGGQGQLTIRWKSTHPSLESFVPPGSPRRGPPRQGWLGTYANVCQNARYLLAGMVPPSESPCTHPCVNAVSLLGPE